MPTWSGQSDKDALHWGSDTYKRLGNVIYLLHMGKRDQAYQEFVELKRMFVVIEFDEYINALDNYRKLTGTLPLSDIIAQIRRERLPSTNWQAADGKNENDTMLPEMKAELSKVSKYQILIDLLCGKNDV